LKELRNEQNDSIASGAGPRSLCRRRYGLRSVFGRHGSSGTPSPGIAKMMGVKPASDPDYKKESEADMIASVKNGKNKMKAFSGKLSDDQIKDAVTYFRSLK
jgi:Cytochrome C oxidase, cbb3-type, subunit III